MHACLVCRARGVPLIAIALWWPCQSVKASAQIDRWWFIAPHFRTLCALRHHSSQEIAAMNAAAHPRPSQRNP